MKYKRLGALVIGIATVFMLFPVSTTKAQTGFQFGGLTSFSITCTCSAALWVWYTPLWLGPIMMTGPMVYAPYGTLLWSNYSIGVPSRWALGSYTPGVQSCWMYAGFFCFPLPTIGHMIQVGTS